MLSMRRTEKPGYVCVLAKGTPVKTSGLDLLRNNGMFWGGEYVCQLLPLSLLESQRGLYNLYWPWIISYFTQSCNTILVKKKKKHLYFSVFNFQKFLLQQLEVQETSIGKIRSLYLHAKPQSW